MAVERTKSIRDPKPVYKTADGIQQPGVTTVVGLREKPALVEWAFRVGKENPQLYSVRQYTDELAEVGKAAHTMIAAHLKGLAPNIDDYTPAAVRMAEVPFSKYLEWAKGKKIEVIFADSKQLVSETYRYGGTVDLLARIDGIVTVLDFKTGKAIYDEMFFQVAAYAHLVEECVSLKVEQIRILQIGRVGAEGFTERVMTDWSTELRWFLAMREVYAIEKEREYIAKNGARAAGDRASGRVISFNDRKAAVAAREVKPA